MIFNFLFLPHVHVLLDLFHDRGFERSRLVAWSRQPGLRLAVGAPLPIRYVTHSWVLACWRALRFVMGVDRCRLVIEAFRPRPCALFFNVMWTPTTTESGRYQ